MWRWSCESQPPAQYYVSYLWVWVYGEARGRAQRPRMRARVTVRVRGQASNDSTSDWLLSRPVSCRPWKPSSQSRRLNQYNECRGKETTSSGEDRVHCLIHGKDVDPKEGFLHVHAGSLALCGDSLEQVEKDGGPCVTDEMRGLAEEGFPP